MSVFHSGELGVTSASDTQTLPIFVHIINHQSNDDSREIASLLWFGNRKYLRQWKWSDNTTGKWLHFNAVTCSEPGTDTEFEFFAPIESKSLDNNCCPKNGGAFRVIMRYKGCQFVRRHESFCVLVGNDPSKASPFILEPRLSLQKL